MSQLFCSKIILILIFAEFAFGDTSENYLFSAGAEQYEPNWASLDSRPLPKWYDAAKVGIFIHWGVYSVPTQGTEWFWTNWRNQNISSYVDYMNKNFKPRFTYQEFANDFTAEHFNANEWARIFESSGAKYETINWICRFYKKRDFSVFDFEDTSCWRANITMGMHCGRRNIHLAGIRWTLGLIETS